MQLRKDLRLEEAVYFQIDRTIRRVRQYSQQQFQRYNFDLTIDQWIIFKQVGEGDGVSLVSIADNTFKDPASVTRIVDALQKKGLVEKRMNPNDRRKFDVYLTEEGSTVLTSMIPRVVDIRAKGLSGIPEEELNAMSKVLSKIYENVDAALI
ncbi:MarR family winged helix-turn-helix transcriptional regulator [Pontibacter sp. G13]|uniref:MarR family winged helix-turn-helix transcriptional regulator n=1 Tax=Pontibacter sp. G13 TaxID=3074898 RepID=UPI0028891112|nr:MarR family winged helix-turn-helix transcriptional regulator [Pontibacter sp. G13]WNJ17676.1 MarR family winged helix-turn-helix transcriptional regulator [Pontibacter sp. G13]